MADFDIQGKITYDATQATSALKGVSQAAGETAKQTDKVADATQKSQVQIGQFGSALGLAGQAAGKLSPALGGIISVAGSATGVIQGLTTAGLGPLGVALAAVSVGVTAAIGLWDAFSGAQKNASNETESLTRSIYRAADAYDELAARRKRQDEQTAVRRRIGMGIGSAEETDIERQRIQERLDLLSATNFREQNTREIARLEQQLATLEENVRVVAALGPAPSETQAAQAEQPAERRRRGGGGGRRAATNVPQRLTLEQLMQQSGGGALSLEGLDMETLGRGEDDWMAEQDNARAKQAVADEAAAADKLRLAEDVSKERQRIEDEMNSALLGSLESALSSSVDAWLSGTRSMGEAMQDMVKQVAKSLASEAIIQGLKETALGIGALATGSPTAAVHFAAAGKWAAVGAAAGLVGAATGAFGGGGGGGGGAPAAATGGPALTAGAGAGAGTTVVINWGSSGLVYAADRAQLGRDISGMISEAHGRLGRGM